MPSRRQYPFGERFLSNDHGVRTSVTALPEAGTFIHNPLSTSRCTPTMAAATGMSQSAISRIWRAAARREPREAVSGAGGTGMPRPPW